MPKSLLRIAFLSLVWTALVAESIGADPPDRIFVNGSVVTMAGPGHTIEAVAVREGRISDIGTAEKIRALAGPKTEIIDLAGKTLLPGFYAAHDHFPQVGRVALFDVDLNPPPVGPVRNMSDLQAALKKKADATAPGKWVVGRGYDDTLLAEQRHPTRHDLDQVSREHPIWIVHTSGHLGVANSKALDLAKITRDTPQPDGGVIRKDVTGEPTGVFEERLTLVTRLVANLTSAQRIETIRYCDTMYLAKGVTTTFVAGGMQAIIPDLIQAYETDGLHLRVIGLLAGNNAPAPVPIETRDKLSSVPEFIRPIGVKLGQDGSLQGYTGYLTAPYYKQPEGKEGYSGYPIRSREKMVEMVTAWHRAGYQVAVHGNGDASIDDILHAFRIANQLFPRTGTRHRIEHCQTPREDQLATMRELGVTPSFFVGHVYYWGDRHRDIFLGPERASRISPLKSALDHGLKFTIHNDTPVTPVDPLLLVWCSVNRVTRDGKVLGPEQRIGVYEALAAVTRDAAWQSFEEDTKGTIEPGKLADLVILAENPLTADPMRIKDIPIIETIVGGRTVYRRPPGR